jgi:CRP/FNR family cyclic AMP-dependent transcriptional regulator
MSSTERQKANKQAIDQLVRYCHKKTYPSKAIIVRPGDKGTSLFFIIEGSISILAEDGGSSRELVLAYLNKNEFIGEIGVFKGPEIRRVTIKARCDCQLAEITYERFEQLLKKDLNEFAADIMYMLAEQLSRRLLASNRKFIDLAFMDVEGRILRTLTDLCKQPDAITHPDGMQISISRQEIGRIVGCSREMAGRVLKELELKKLITAHGKTVVVFGTR